MKKIIHKLRQQPVEVRRHLLHLSTLVCAIVLVFVWFYTLGNSLNDADTKARVANDVKPLSAMQGNLISGYQSIVGSN